MKKISVVLGTRPEAIKLCPLIRVLRQQEEFAVEVCVTGQHKEMLQQVLDIFNITPDVNLQVMRDDQSLAGVTTAIIEGMNKYLYASKPDLLVIQGDTTTVMAAALTAFYNHVPIAHVEAGLRTGNLYSPWPEEGNRIIAGHLADIHFCPTEKSRENLLREGINENKIFVTGNTVIDALFTTLDQVENECVKIKGLPSDIQDGTCRRKMVLITGHRRENFGQGFLNICRAIRILSEKFTDVDFVYPVHLNPNVRNVVLKELTNSGSSIENIYLIDPLSYRDFVIMMKRATVILTDSGGVQEEAPSLGKPVLVMRDNTERPEALEAGTVKLVGTNVDSIVDEVSRLLLDECYYKTISDAVNPYGDGTACEKIVNVLQEYFGKSL